MCVESLLKNIPKGLNYELILHDHGSTDGTEAYFESIHPTKLIKTKFNRGGSEPVRSVEARLLFGISNDVILLPGAIENMLACMESSNNIARVVPTTPNVSNLQTVVTQYNDFDEMEAFARRNNVQDPYRWEQRTRLVDPLSLNNMKLCSSKEGICNGGYLNRDAFMFPDDRMALLSRRAGYKLYLAKDAYCHHFGSVTLKDEVTQQNEQKFYNAGRQRFQEWFGIDPWGTGFCYDPIFLDRVVGEHIGHVEVLGISCGMGSNSLKIKEQIKEYCHNTDCSLTNLTDNPAYLPDLLGISDCAEMVNKIKDFKRVLDGRSYDYIVWDDPFLSQYKFSTLLDLCRNHLAPSGTLLLRRTEQSKSLLGEQKGNWLILRSTPMNGRRDT